MILLRIGDRYINFDQVRYVDTHEPAGVRIYFAGDNGRMEPLELEGKEAVALKQWLGQHSTEAKPLPESWRHTRAGRVETGR